MLWVLPTTIFGISEFSPDQMILFLNASGFEKKGIELFVGTILSHLGFFPS